MSRSLAPQLGATLLVGLVTISAPAAAKPIDRFVGWERMDAALHLSYLRHQPSAPADRVSFFVQSRTPQQTAQVIRTLGGQVGTIAGDVLTVRAPTALLPLLVTGPATLRLEGAVRVRSRLDRALPAMKVDQVHAGQAPLTGAYRGQGVVVGVIDSGLDLAHKAFLDGSGKSRVLEMWDQAATGGTPPEGYDYGARCDRQSLLASSCDHLPTDSHGTHVTGIAAGSAVNGVPHVGVAPDADIVSVNQSQTPTGSYPDANTTSICDAAAWIFKVAAAAGKPAVINMSLGMHEGPHDGTSLASRCLDNLTGPGKIIVAAAGNEGTPATNQTFNAAVHVHASGTASSSASVVDLAMGRDNSGNAAATIGAVAFDKGADITLRVGVRAGGATVWSSSYKIGGTAVSESLTSGANTIGPLTISGGANSAGVGLILFAVADGNQDNQELNETLLLEVSGSGRWDAWIDTTESGGFLRGAGGATADDRMTIGYPAVAKNVLAVGSYVVRNEWQKDGSSYTQTNDSGQQVSLGALSEFSSRGPSRNPSLTGNVPDITAPGEIVASAIPGGLVANEEASKVLRGAPDAYLLEQGTSMASPAVAGVVALMLQKDPTLTIARIRQVFASTAVKPAGVNGLPNTDWGVGTVDAMAALQAFAGGGGQTTDEGGCQAAPGHPAGTWTAGAALCLLALMVPLALRARRRMNGLRVRR